MFGHVSLLLVALSVVSRDSLADKTVGFVNRIDVERSRADCDAQNIPSWLDGYLLLQSCGAVGEVGKAPLGSYVEHMYDCMGMVSAFNFKDAKATYSNKYYRTRPYAIWADNSRNLTQSSIAWDNSYTTINSIKYQAQLKNYVDLPFILPNVAFWKVDNRMMAVGDMHPGGYYFDAATLDMKGWFPFSDQDNPMGFAAGTFFINNPAHSYTDTDGTVWSTVIAIQTKILGKLYDVQRIVYNIAPQSNKRTIVGKLPMKSVNMDNCAPITVQGGTTTFQYKDTASYNELGHVHAIAVTKRYVVLPTSSYFFNPCMLKDDQARPVMKSWYTYVSTSDKFYARFLIMNKATGEFTPVQLDTDTMFSHIINAYEDNGDIVLDILTHSNVYPDAYLQNWAMDTNVRQYRLRYGAAEMSWNYLTASPVQVLSADFPTMNENLKGQPYSYVYMLQNPFSDNSGILKVNVKTKESRSWKPGTLANQYYPSQPVYVPRPGSTAEDDGVLLVNTLDSINNKGMVFIINAQTLAELGRVTTTDIIPFGLHAVYYSTKDLGLSHAPTFALSGSLMALMLLLTALKDLQC